MSIPVFISHHKSKNRLWKTAVGEFRKLSIIHANSMTFDLQCSKADSDLISPAQIRHKSVHGTQGIYGLYSIYLPHFVSAGNFFGLGFWLFILFWSLFECVGGGRVF